jgi:casein kinase 1
MTSYQDLKKFCSANKEEIEKLVGRPIRCQDKAAVLQGYSNLLTAKKKLSPVKKIFKSANPSPKKIPKTPVSPKKSPLKQEVKKGRTEDICPIKEVAKRWTIGDFLAEGGFGSVYTGRDKKTGEEVAIKVSLPEIRSQGEREAYILKIMSGKPGFPKLLHTGSTKGCYTIVMELFGESVSTRAHNDELPPLSILAPQMIERFQTLHANGIIHRDVKLGNFVFGRGTDKDTVYLIDFGLANFYRNVDGTHMPYRTDFSFKGTYRYASANVLSKIEPSRRDDLISLGYALAEIFKPLPWSGIPKSTKKKGELRAKLGEAKKNLDYDTFCVGLPKGLCEYLKIVTRLGYEEDPPYNKLKSLF